MIIIPAIDLKDGKCVRLRRGVADDVKVYSEDPVRMAERWQEEGAKYLHVVDLDGAFGGEPAHADVINSIIKAVDIPVEVGGGLRSDEHIAGVLEAGADRAIIGTRALRDPESMVALVERFGDKIAVGIDAREGKVQVEGWVETTGESALLLARAVDSLGVGTIIYTDTATDGMMAGTNALAVGEICKAVKCGVIASGGISTSVDIEALNRLGCENLVGAIVGKALYEGRLKLADLQGE